MVRSSTPREFLAGPGEGTVRRFLESEASASLIRRIGERDPSLWKQDPESQKLIRSRLGWLDVARQMRDEAPALVSFAQEIRKEGYGRIVLLGIGGSSLAAEVFQKAVGPGKGCPSLSVLDSTDPEEVNDLASGIDIGKTLFLVSSKSGTTVEPLSLFKYFHNLVQKNLASRGSELRGGDQFIAITDAGGFLATLAQENRFKRIFLNPEDVGGRYSALSYFGLVPAALIGVDIGKILDGALSMMDATGPDRDPASNGALVLGAAMALFAKEGKDKLTLVTGKGWRSFGEWVEQLIAESTGKESRGIVPVAGEPLRGKGAYAADRFFVGVLSDEPEDRALHSRLMEIADEGHPVLIIRVSGAYDLGAEFFRWELATAVAGAILGINPFDQPDVQAAKDQAEAFLKRVASGQRPRLEMSGIEGTEFLGRAGRASEGWKSFWKNLRPGDYIAVLAYLPDCEEVRVHIEEIGEMIRARTGKAVTWGLGPRYLHSSGQLHKGGKGHGVFLILTAARDHDVAIPGERYSFGELQLGQALGDFEALAKRGRRVFHLRMPELSDRCLGSLARELNSVL